MNSPFPSPSMSFEEQNGWVAFDPIGGNFRVYWQGLLMRPTFQRRLVALRYLGALRNGLRKPDFAEQLPAPERFHRANRAGAKS